MKLIQIFAMILLVIVSISAQIIRAPDKVPNKFIVVLQDDKDADAVSKELTKKHGGKIKHVFKNAIKGFSFDGTEESADKISHDPRVRSVEEDRKVKINQTIQRNALWHIDRIDQRNMPIDQLYHYTGTASKVNAYVIDTGIRITHEEFEGRADLAFNNSGLPDGDCNGHGTHIAGIIGSKTYGVAKGIKLHSMQVMFCDGSGYISNLLDAVDWITAHASKPAVVNISVAAAGASPALEAGISASQKDGSIYVVASGNGNYEACNFTPGRIPEILTVGASDEYDNRALYSNFGSCIDLYAPGNRVVSTWSSSDLATNELSGSSMASPMVAGVVALQLALRPHAKPADVIAAVKAKATPNLLANVSGSDNLLLFSDY